MTPHSDPPGARLSLRSASPREQRSEFSKFTWRYLDKDEAERLWEELIDWVWWLRDRYELSPHLPDCWFRHGPVVEELTGAMSAWTAAQTLDSGSDLSLWHSQTLWPLMDRLQRSRPFDDCTGDWCPHDSGFMHVPTGTEALMTADVGNAEDSDMAVVVRIVGEDEMLAAAATGSAAPLGPSSPSQRYRLHGHTWAWSDMLDAFVPVPEPARPMHALPSAR